MTTNERSEPGVDEGFTLIELIVAMALFAGLLAIFGMAVTNFSSATVRINQTTDQATQARVALNLLDRQVRSAAAINRPGLVGNNWYIEYRIDSVSPNTCTQWVLRTDSHTLATRSWVSGLSSAQTPTGWRVLATDVVNTTAQPPFIFSPATTTVVNQRLGVNLRYQQGVNGPLRTTSSTYAARNSSTSTTTNPVGSALACGTSTISGAMRP